MTVTVKGVVTSIREVTRNDKMYIEVMLYQDGQQMLVRCRFMTDFPSDIKLGSMATITGYLITWAGNSGSIGSMIRVA